MKKLRFAAALIALSMMMSGCSQLTIGSSDESSSAETPSVTIGSSINDDEENTVDTSLIPTELESEGVFVSHWQDWDLESLPSQYLMEMDDTAYMLIEQVQNVTADLTVPTTFDGIEHAPTNALLRIALEHTPAIELSVEFELDEDGNLTAISSQYPNHALVHLLQNELEEGRDLREFYYQEDVTAVYARLFGDGRLLSFQDLCPNYYYYAREGVFAHKGEKTDSNIWPMLVDHTDGEDTVTVDLLLTEGSDPEKPLTYLRADGSSVELTAENYQDELAGEPVYRYTFQKVSDTQLTLDGIRQIGVLNDSCDQVVSVDLPVEDTSPQLEAPERLLFSSDGAQRQIDLQKEYEGTTALEYLLDLLGEAQEVQGSASTQVLAASGSRTLTLTFGYTEGEEVVLNVMSSGYLPGIPESYMTFSIGSTQYVLPQEDYSLLSGCLNSCIQAA